MATVLEPDRTETTVDASQRMRAVMTAARLSFNWLGVRKTLTSEQKSQAAHSFAAESKYLSASKKLLDTGHPAFKAVTAIRSQAVSYWRASSLPYPEPGIRLIKRDAIAAFDSRMASFRSELDEVVQTLDQHFVELREAARDRLGDLFNSTDYPTTLIGEFSIEHTFPSVEPPNYLRQLSPDLYDQECRRVQSRFNDAVLMAEQAFVEELSKLIEHLTQRLSGVDDGKPKVFRDSIVTNLSDFFDRFRDLNIGSSEQLESLVVQAQNAVRGVDPQQLRSSDQLRQIVATRMSSVQAGLDQMMVDRPRRNIQRRPR